MIRSALIAAFLLVFMSAVSFGAPVALQWDLPADTTGIDGYRIQCGPTGQAFSISQSVAGATTNQTVVDLPTGEWYCVAQSYSDSGNTSTYSNTLTLWVHDAPTPPQPGTPLAAPLNITVIVQTGS